MCARAGQWYFYNDRRVRAVTPAHVASAQAYLLFYRRFPRPAWSLGRSGRDHDLSALLADWSWNPQSGTDTPPASFLATLAAENAANEDDDDDEGSDSGEDDGSDESAGSSLEDDDDDEDEDEDDDAPAARGRRGQPVGRGKRGAPASHAGGRKVAAAAAARGGKTAGRGARAVPTAAPASLPAPAPLVVPPWRRSAAAMAEQKIALASRTRGSVQSAPAAPVVAKAKRSAPPAGATTSRARRVRS